MEEGVSAIRRCNVASQAACYRRAFPAQGEGNGGSANYHLCQPQCWALWTQRSKFFNFICFLSLLDAKSFVTTPSYLPLLVHSQEKKKTLGSAIGTSDKTQNSAEIRPRCTWCPKKMTNRIEPWILLIDYFYNGHQGAKVLKIRTFCSNSKIHVYSYNITKTPVVKDFKSFVELRIK